VSAKPSTVRRIGVGLVLAGAALVSAGCAAGQHAATADEQSTMDGVNGDVGKIALRGVAIVAPTGTPAYAPGSDVALKIVIINNSGAADSLVDIKTSLASGWANFSTAADAQAVIDADQAGAEATSTAASSSAASSSSSASTSPSSSPSSSSSSPAAPPLPIGTQSVDLPPGVNVGFGTPTSTGAILIEGLTATVYPAQTITITFTFKTAGSVTLQVPVQITDGAHGATVPPLSSSAGE